MERKWNLRELLLFSAHLHLHQIGKLNHILLDRLKTNQLLKLCVGYAVLDPGQCANLVFPARLLIPSLVCLAFRTCSGLSVWLPIRLPFRICYGLPVHTAAACVRNAILRIVSGFPGHGNVPEQFYKPVI